MAHNVRAVVFNETGKFLVVSEADDPNNFKLPGGKFEGEESSDQAIRRELREELSLEASSYLLTLVATLETEEERDNRYIYLVNLNPGVPVSPVDEEIARFMWVDEQTVPEGKNKEHILSAVKSVRAFQSENN
jgi:ADP-ribose pyrophosphatase YjhB (NUDIX family)